MRKMQLSLDDLCVEGFTTNDEQARGAGTVKANEDTPACPVTGNTACNSCQWSNCNTCDLPTRDNFPCCA